MSKISDYKIVTETEEIITRYVTTPVNILDNLRFYQWDTIRMCEFYSNSRYLTGNKDELGRDKPFYNIVNYRVTLAKVATDLDVKDIVITADEPEDWVRSMLLNHEAYEWMKATNFAYFLNDMGQKRPKYGGVMVKKSEVDGVLHIDTCDWRNMVVDAIDIMRGTKIEKHYMTPVELSEKEGIWDNVREAIMLAAKKMERQYGYNQQEYNSNRIQVNEVHGQFPVCFIKNALGEEESEDDYYTFSKQRYFYTKMNDKTIIFLAEEFKEEVYDYLPWEEMPGRGLGRGVIEDAKEAQVWTNDSVINEKNAMDLAGRVGIKTNSKKFGNNILEHDHGKIYELEDGKDINTFNLAPSALGEYQNQVEKWKSQADLSTSSLDAITGEQPVSGTPYSQTALLNQVASKPFDYRREEAGIFITRMFESWVIPYLIKKLKKKHLLVSDFSEEELTTIDNSFAIHKANTEVIDGLTKGNPTTPERYQAIVLAEKSKLQGEKRYFDIPDKYFDGIEAKVTVVTTNEQKNKAAVLQSLSTILQTVQASFNPNTGTFGVLDNPVLSKIFGTIIELSGAGISPVSLGLGKPGAQQGQNAPTVPVPMAQPLPAAQPIA